MQKLNHQDLYSLEQYADIRDRFRDQAMQHKRNRQVYLGEHIALHFEDRLLMHYQIQEMLRAERIFEREGIQEELNAYNPLIPDGSNWKATMMIQYPEVEERRQRLTEMLEIENKVWAKISGFEPQYAIADEDLERSTDEKTSSVHFLRFELSAQSIASLKQGASLAFGVTHPAYSASVDPVPNNIRESLLDDLT